MKTIISIVVVIAVLFGGYFIIKGNRAAGVPTVQNEMATSTTISSTSTVPMSKKMAFTDFVKQGGSYQCSVNQYTGNVATKGTAYLSNKMLRAEFNTTIQGKAVESALLVKDGFAYVWSSFMPGAGFKMKAEVKENADATTTAAGTASGSYKYGPEAFGDYDCQPWTADSSKFDLPAGVTFRAM